MESDVENVARSLKKNRRSLTENAQQYQLVQSSEIYGETACDIDHSSGSLTQATDALQPRSVMVHNTAQQLNQLVGVFQVSHH